MRGIRGCVFVALTGLLCSCGGREPEEPTGKLKVFVSIVPQAYFVERVGGEHVEVDVLVGSGQSPATYEPTPKQMARLQRARVYFRIGVPFENAFLRKVESVCKGLRIVDTREGITLRTMTAHHHHEEADHEHLGTKDPHIWLDPSLVKIQAATICKALAELDPAHAEEYEANLAAFRKDLEATDARIRQALAPLKGKKLFVFHPAFGYFADAYGLEQTAVELEGKEPSAKQLARLIEEARRQEVRVIFVQRQFSSSGAQAVAKAIGGAVVPIDPLARDYLENLEYITAAIKAGLK